MRKKNKKLTLLLIGPLPPPLGGSTILFDQLAHELSTYADIDLKIINTSGAKSFASMARVLVQTFIMVPQSDLISLHASNRRCLLQGPIVWALCKIWRKPWILRVFGGAFDQAYTSLSRIMRCLVRKTVLAANLNLFETKHLVQFFEKSAIAEVAWYPNSRPVPVMQANLNQEPRCATKFVSLGLVTADKGIREIIEAGERLGSSIQVDIYGPLSGDITERDFVGLRKVRYCGVLEPQRVSSTLHSYDVLLLPTHYETEGYPGVIIEAYSVGLPVIAAKCGAIPEIVDETSGLLIEPRASSQLQKAMTQLMTDQQLYQSLRHGVARKREFFRSERWTRAFITHCKSIAGQDGWNA